MPFWVIALVILGATIAFNALMASRIKPEKRKAAGLGDFNFPTAQENREIAVVVGTVIQKGPNSVWNGDLLTSPIKKKVPNPAFFGLVKKTVETGQYRYFVGMALVLGQGDGGVTLKEFQVDDKVCWSGSLNTASTFSFDKSNLFGGEEKEGGYAGTFDYYPGLWNQTYNNYLETQLVAAGKKARNWKGVTYLVQRGPSSGTLNSTTPNGYIGISESLKPYSFVLQRFPNHLGQSQYTVINSDDANPIEWAYELLTNFDYGANVPPTSIDIDTFKAAAKTCYDEGIGLSVLWDTDRDISDVLQDISELADGAIYVDRTTGLWTCTLARADYDIEDLYIFDADGKNVLEEIDFSINTGKDAPAQILVPFVDKSQNFKTREADFKDLAIRRNHAAPFIKKQEFYGVSNGEQASLLALREARIFASNLRKVTFKSNREGHWVRPLSVFIYRRKDDVTGDVLDTVFRTARVDDGEFVEGSIEIEAIQDVFSLGTFNYSPPSTTGWVPIDNTAVPVVNHYSTEQPYIISGPRFRLWNFAQQPNGAQLNYDLWVKLSTESSYQMVDPGADFSISGTLVNSYSRIRDRDTSNSLIISIPQNQIFRLESASANDIQSQMKNLFIFADTGEICAFETFTNNGDGTVTLNNVWRGLIDTAIENHNSGTRVWFASYGQSVSEYEALFNQIYSLKETPNSSRGQVVLADATSTAVTITGRATRPLAPVDVTINGTWNATTILATGNNITFAWKVRNRLTQTQILRQSEASVGPEAAATVTLRIYNSAGSLIATKSGLTGTSYIYTSAEQTSDGATGNFLTFVLSSDLNGVSSYQGVILPVTRPGGVVGIIPVFNTSGTSLIPIPGNATSVGGQVVSGTPSGSNQVMLTDGNGNLIWVTGLITAEQIQDMLGTFFTAGTGISISYNDAGNVMTIAATGEGGGSMTVREIDGSPSGIATILEFPNGQVSDQGGGVFRITPLQGATGNTGAAGTPGSIWYAGAVTPPSGTGINNDFYIHTDTGEIYKKISGSWVSQGNIRGPQGIQGVQGASVLTGSGIPSGGTGSNNDLYLNTDNGDFYKKISGSWVYQINLVGPSGQALPRQEVDIVISNFINGSTRIGTVPLAKSFALMNVETSDLSRIRLYMRADKRTADASRDVLTSPNITEPHGVILDLNVDREAYKNFPLSPEVYGANMESVPSVNIPYSITNFSGNDILEYVCTLTFTVEEE